MPGSRNTPLPAALSGEIVERLIRVDKSLLPYIAGALEYATDREPYDQTGILTVDQAREALGQMIWDFYHEEAMGAMIGEYKMLSHAEVPDKWLLCRGGVVAEADYPALFAVIGHLYDTGGEGAANFRLPNFGLRSPFGAPDDIYIGARDGNLTETLSISNLPPHTHSIARGGSGAPNIPQVNASVGSGNAPFTTGSTGTGTPFSILHPILYTNIIIYAGE